VTGWRADQRSNGLSVDQRRQQRVASANTLVPVLFGKLGDIVQRNLG